jgi:hypothetical protein
MAMTSCARVEGPSWRAALWVQEGAAITSGWPLCLIGHLKRETRAPLERPCMAERKEKSPRLCQLLIARVLAPEETGD